MINLIIVEDEPLMNEFMVASLDKESAYVELKGRFYNGKTAYNYIKNNPVDIVVTDIKMPVMDGLDLIRSVMEIKPEIKFIVVSGHDDFFMVREAFKMGVKDYMLKTEFESDKFNNFLKELASDISSRQDSEEGIRQKRELLLRRFIWNKEDVPVAIEQPRFDMSERLFVSVLRLINYKKLYLDEKEAFITEVSGVLNEVINDTFKGEYFFNTQDEIVFILSARNIGLIKPRFTGVFHDIIDALRDKLGMECAFFVYDKDLNLPLKVQYRELMNIVDYIFVIGKNRIISYAGVAGFCDNADIKSDFELIKSEINQLKFLLVGDTLNRISKIRPDRDGIATLRNEYRNLLTFLYIYCDKHDIKDVGYIIEINVEELTQEELNELILQIIHKISSSIFGTDVNMIKIGDYIKKNYCKNITLGSIAKEFNFDYTSLSRRFKKEMGIPFSRYLENVRLNEALELVTTTDFKIYDISFMVGYNSYEYFIRAFKKKFNYLPNDIRKVKKKQ